MNLLLDTHAFLWFIAGNSSLSRKARAAIEDQNNGVLLSVASLWEIAIKISLGKITLSESFDKLIPEQLTANGIELLDISVEHTASLQRCHSIIATRLTVSSRHRLR
jgi:PIN domain nuclease of toxin-antitoxin system